MSLVCQAFPEALLLLVLAGEAAALLCYNGSLTSLRYGDDPLVYGSGVNVTRLKWSMTIWCDENAMCYVRSWSARAKHSWLVQRGCYRASKEDPLPRSVRSPTRAMACKRERYRDAEYRVCLCQADWCNSAESRELHRWLHFAIIVGVAAGSVIRYWCLSL